MVLLTNHEKSLVVSDFAHWDTCIYSLKSDSLGVIGIMGKAWEKKP